MVVAKEGATVSLAGATGGAEVIALENNVAVTDAPVGTTIAAKEGVTGTTANGQTVAPDSEITITAPSTGGGDNPSIIDPDDPGTDDPEESDPRRQMIQRSQILLRQKIQKNPHL